MIGLAFARIPGRFLKFSLSTDFCHLILYPLKLMDLQEFFTLENYYNHKIVEKELFGFIQFHPWE